MARATAIVLAVLLASSAAAGGGGAAPAPASGEPVAAAGTWGGVGVATTSQGEGPNATLSRNATRVTPDGAVRFTLTAVRGPVVVPDPMPYVVQRRVGERWQTVYTPIAPAVVPPPIAPGLDPPTDPDGDGLFEDVDGSGAFTVVDVAALLDELRSAGATAGP